MDILDRFKKSFDDRNIVRVAPKEHLAKIDSKILTTQEIITDYIDWDSIQSFQNFSEKNEVRYLPGDFCLQLSKETILKLKDKDCGRIDLSEVDKIGWFGKEKHNEKWSNFRTLNNFVSIEIKEMTEICNFSQFKKNIKNTAETDALKGGLGIAYMYHEEEYQNFLSKIIWRNNEWRIASEDLEPDFSIPILLQLMLFQNNRDGKFFNEISQSLDKKIQDYFLLLNDIMIISLNCFSTESYQGKNHYLNRLIASFKSKQADTQELQSKIDKLILELEKMKVAHNEGIQYEPQSRYSKIINDFIDLSDIGTENLKESLDSSSKNYSITVYFLLGMMHLYSRTQKQFYIKSLIHYIVSVTSYKISDIEFGDNYISLLFSISPDDSAWNSQFKFIKKQFDIIKEIKGFSSDTKELEKRYKERKNQLNPVLKEHEKEIKSIQDDIRKKRIEKEEVYRELDKIITDTLLLKEEIHNISKSSSLDDKKRYETFKIEFSKTQDWNKFKKDFKGLKKAGFANFVDKLKKDKDIKRFEQDNLKRNSDGSFNMSLQNKKYIIDICIDSWKEDSKQLELEELGKIAYEKTVDVLRDKDDPHSILKIPIDELDKYLEDNPNSCEA